MIRDANRQSGSTGIPAAWRGDAAQSKDICGVRLDTMFLAKIPALVAPWHFLTNNRCAIGPAAPCQLTALA